MIIDCDLPWPDGEQPSVDEEARLRWKRTTVHARQALTQILALGKVQRGMLAIRDDDAKRLLSFESDVNWY